MPANSVIQFRRGTAAQWTSANPVLANGEPGYETDTGKEKLGDGTTAWTSLAYFAAGTVADAVVRTKDAGDTQQGVTRRIQINDLAGAAGSALQLEHFGDGTGNGQNQAYALEVHNHVGAQPAFVIHQYSNNKPAILLDNTNSNDCVRISLTENGGQSPGNHGSGNYFSFYGYASRTVVNDAVTTSGSAVVTSATAAWVAQDQGKTLSSTTDSGISGATISTVNSATQITMSKVATTTGTTANLQFNKLADVGAVAKLDKDLTFWSQGLTPFTFLSATGSTVALQVQQGTSATKTALAVLQTGAGVGTSITHTGTSGSALTVDSSSPTYAVLVTALTGSEGFNPLRVAGLNYGPSFTTSTDGGSALQVTKSGTGNGTGATITNAGTGNALLVTQNGAAVGVQVTANAGAAGSYMLAMSGQDYGEQVVTATNGGVTLRLVKNGTGSGTVQQIVNKGFGLSLDITNGTSTMVSIDQNGNIISTTTGIKIGTATSQKLGFFNAAPVVQQSAGTTATDAATTQTLVNQLRSSLVALGLVA